MLFYSYVHPLTDNKENQGKASKTGKFAQKSVEIYLSAYTEGFLYIILWSLNDQEKFLVRRTGNSAGIRNNGCRVRINQRQ